MTCPCCGVLLTKRIKDEEKCTEEEPERDDRDEEDSL